MKLMKWMGVLIQDNINEFINNILIVLLLLMVSSIIFSNNFNGESAYSFDFQHFLLTLITSPSFS